MSELKHICGGIWNPIHGWIGRYRCGSCHIMGYRSMVRANKEVTGKLGSHIIQYKCKKCKRGAVQGSPRKRTLLCKEHSNT